VLVTSGFYAYVRHPSYFGWFWWSIGLQVLLGNPLCVMAYSYASWKFFAERIPYEEMTLLEFFGAKFDEYRNRVPTGIPMIK
jgi:protein-S-isoprenylcysteine O-methyltransferase